MIKRKYGAKLLLALGIAILLLATGCEPLLGTNDSATGDGIGNTGEGGGFLWKPVSGYGKLVILTPPQYTGRVSGVYVANANGDMMEQGFFSAVANGGREHFRFSKPGGAYGNDVYAVAELKDGKSVNWHIPFGSQRTQY
jgi:hypothetical protein